MSGDSAVDAVQLFIANYEKKLRNLIKRKAKLDAYRDRLHKGEGLNDEQRKAVEGYDCVVQNITFVQEFIQHSKELVDNVERSMHLREQSIEEEHERYTLRFLRVQSTIMRLLNSLDSPIVRTAIMRSSSENHLKLLDITRTLVTGPLLDDWPGNSSTALGNACEFLEQHASLNLTASHNFNLVAGKNLPIPLPEGSGCSLKKHSFKEVRSLCFRLLATPAVQRSLGMSSRPASVSSSANENLEVHTNEQPPEIHGDYVLVTNGVKTEIVDSNLDQSSPVDSTQHDHQQHIPKHLDHGIKPLAPTFNFLQASKVINVEPETPLVPAVGLVKTSPIVPVSEVNKTNVEAHSPHIYADNIRQGIHQPVDIQFPQSYNSDVTTENGAMATQASLDVHDTHPSDNLPTTTEPHQFSENGDQMYCESVTPASPGKVSYADLLRRPTTNRVALSANTDHHTDVVTKRDQSTGNVTTPTSITFEPAEQHHNTNFDQQPIRSGSSRGGRSRGFSAAGRGSGHFYPGGMYRGGRGGGMRGGRGPPTRGMRTGMAQPTY